MERNTKVLIPDKALLIDNVLSKNLTFEAKATIKMSVTAMKFDPTCSASGVDTVERFLFKKLWGKIKSYIPPKVDGDELIGVDYSSPRFNIYKPNKDFKCKRKNLDKLLVTIYLDNQNIRIVDDRGNYLDVNIEEGSILILHQDITYKKLSHIDDYDYYTISFSIKYANSNKHIKVSEVSKIPDCIYPNSNGLKYKNAEIMIDNYVYQISPDPKSSLFDSRWNKVMGREHVFSIEICSINPSIDKTKGRPPTDYEDFCPNCYEILPVIKDYKKCPGCLSDVVKTDKTLKSNVLLGYG